MSQQHRPARHADLVSYVRFDANPMDDSAHFGLEVVNLSKCFGTTKAVEGLNLKVATGSLYAFLGPNGAGKTTSLRMMAGLLKPDTGDILVDGVSLSRSPQDGKSRLAYIADEPVLYGKLRPLEFLEFVAALWSVPVSKSEPAAQALLEQLGLWEYRFSMIGSFSRGMRQKISLAAAFVHSPRVILLDEPLTGLDPAAARIVKDMLGKFVADGGTVILATHILEVAERIANRIGILSRGALIAEGTFEELRCQAGQSRGTLEDVFLSMTSTPSAASTSQ